jgi:hypothetical protein
MSNEVSRRSVLRAGAVTGSAVWLAPVLTVVGADAARADVASGGQQPPANETDPREEVVLTSSLPRTGSDALVAGFTGVGLVAGGAMAVRAAQRPRAAQQSE